MAQGAGWEISLPWLLEKGSSSYPLACATHPHPRQHGLGFEQPSAPVWPRASCFQNSLTPTLPGVFKLF